MTRRLSEYRPSSYKNLVHAAGDRMDQSAQEELKRYRELVAKGQLPIVAQNGYGHWRVYDPADRKPPLPRPK